MSGGRYPVVTVAVVIPGVYCLRSKGAEGLRGGGWWGGGVVWGCWGRRGGDPAHLGDGALLVELRHGAFSEKLRGRIRRVST